MSPDTYPQDWNEIATRIKEHAHWKCENCSHPHDPQHGYILTVRHLDAHPSNCHPDNLVALCQKCHLHFQNKRNLLQTSFFTLPPWRQKLFIPTK